MGSNEEEAKLTHEGDDDSEPEQVTARARLRIAELLEKPFDIRSLALTGLFILAVFYTIYYLRSVLLPIVLALLLSYYSVRLCAASHGSKFRHFSAPPSS